VASKNCSGKRGAGAVLPSEKAEIAELGFASPSYTMSVNGFII
jgi:hypothetical protein